MEVRENNESVSQCNVLGTSFSDHDAIVGLTALNSSLTDCRVVCSRNLRKINSAKMEADIQHLLDTELADCTNTELADRYSAGLRRVLGPGSRRVSNGLTNIRRATNIKFSVRNSGVMWLCRVLLFVSVLVTLHQPPPVRKCMSSH